MSKPQKTTDEASDGGLLQPRLVRRWRIMFDTADYECRPHTVTFREPVEKPHVMTYALKYMADHPEKKLAFLDDIFPVDEVSPPNDPILARRNSGPPKQ